MKSRGGKSQRREEKKKEDQKRESLRRKMIKVREKVGKSRNVVFFQWFEAAEGRKVGSLKRRVRSQLARWEMKIARRCGAKHISKTKCRKHQLRTTFGSWDVEKVHALVARSTFRSQMYKAHQVRTTFGSWDVEKVNAVVARSTFRSQNVQSTPGSDHFWKLRCRKSARRCGAKHIWKSKVEKTEGFGALFDVQMSRGTFEEDLQRCIFHGSRSTRDMFIRAVRRSGRWFPERGCILEHQICRFAKMILRDRCSTSYDLASLFRGRPSTSDRWSGKITKRIGTGRQLYTQVSIFEGSLTELLRFLMLSTSKNEEVSQNCFVFDVDVVKFKNWGSLAE